MPQSDAEQEATPDENLPRTLCGCNVVETLAEGETYLAIGPGGRGWALKKLPDDCLHGRALHPSILQRLQRVRELAHPGVANLYGVTWEGDAAWMQWEYVPGSSGIQWARSQTETRRSLVRFARSLVNAVEAMHGLGVVHGSITTNNCIVDESGQLRLTHVSPYLYTDPQDDLDSLLDLLEEVIAGSPEPPPALRELIAEARASSLSLHALAGRLTLLAERGEAPAPQVVLRSRDRRARLVAFLAAAGVAAAGAGAAWGVWKVVHSPDLSGKFRDVQGGRP